jgi:Fe-S-cluster-containing hydrogenase component 2
MKPCNGCGKCVTACPVEALTVAAAGDPDRPERRRAQVDEDICLGCGVCVRACSRDGLSLKSRAARVITPVNSTHRVVLMAIERGTLQDLIFDQRVFWNHRALAAVLGVILRLPPVKQALARQFRSRYLENLIARSSRVHPRQGRRRSQGTGPPGSTPGGRFILSARSSATSATPSSSSRRTTAPSGDRSTYRWAPAAPGRSHRTR